MITTLRNHTMLLLWAFIKVLVKNIPVDTFGEINFIMLFILLHHSQQHDETSKNASILSLESNLLQAIIFDYTKWHYWFHINIYMGR